MRFTAADKSHAVHQEGLPPGLVALQAVAVVPARPVDALGVDGTLVQSQCALVNVWLVGWLVREQSRMNDWLAHTHFNNLLS